MADQTSNQSADGGAQGQGMLRHGSCVVLHGRALLIEGPSGSGKSTLALELLALGAALIADDQTWLTPRGPQLWASAPPTLPAAIEIRGLGLVPVPLAPPAPLALQIDLSQTETRRLPEPRHCTILGQTLPSLHKIEGSHFPAAIRQYLLSMEAPR